MRAESGWAGGGLADTAWPLLLLLGCLMVCGRRKDQRLWKCCCSCSVLLLLLLLLLIVVEDLWRLMEDRSGRRGAEQYTCRQQSIVSADNRNTTLCDSLLGRQVISLMAYG